MLRNWIESEESFNLYQRLIQDLQLPQTPEQFGPTLIALLCREQLFSNSTDETAQPNWGSSLADFDAILHLLDIKNKQAVFEQMILSLWRVLSTLSISDETVQLFGEVLSIRASLQEPLAGITDQYTIRKVHGYHHHRAFQEANTVLLNSTEAMSKRVNYQY